MSASEKYRWTEEEVAILHRMADEGKTLGEVVEALSLSRRAVRLKAWRLGIQFIRASGGGHGTSEGAKKRWATSGRKEALSERMKAYWSDPKNREAQRSRMREVHANPVKHANIADGVRAALKRNPRPKSLDRFVIEERKDGRAESNRKRWDNPSFREAITAGRDAFFSDPKNRSRHAESCRQARLRPDVVEKFRRIQKEGSSIERVLWGILGGLGLEEGRDWERHFQVGPYQFDVLLRRPGKTDFLVEANGDYWHSLDRVRRVDDSKRTYIDNYFRGKYEVRTLWEHEFLAVNRVADTVRRWVGLEETRPFDFSEVSVEDIPAGDARDFLGRYHYLGGIGRGGVCVGASIGEEMVAVAVFSHLARQNIAGRMGEDFGTVRELSRFAIKPDRHAENFGSWFLSRAVRLEWEREQEVRLLISYADETYGHSGGLYRAAGWLEDGEVAPDYWYVDEGGFVTGKQALYRHASRMGMVEADFAEANGLVKVFGRRKLRFILRRA
jgi:hypothetical protein